MMNLSQICFRLLLLGFLFQSLFLSFAQSAVDAQEVSEISSIKSEIWNGRVRLLNLVSAIESNSGYLEVTALQQKKLAKSKEAYRSQASKKFGSNDLHVLVDFHAEIVDFENEIRTKILLPHQLVALGHVEERKEFLRSGALWSRYLLHHQKERFRLSDRQRESIKEIADESKARESALELERRDFFKASLAEEAAALSEVLSKEQWKIIERASRSFVR